MPQQNSITQIYSTPDNVMVAVVILIYYLYWSSTLQITKGGWRVICIIDRSWMESTVYGKLQCQHGMPYN